MRFAIFVSLMAALAMAQSVPTVGSLVGNLEGTVTDTVRQAPIGKARVTLVPRFGIVPPAPGGPFAAVTDSSGSFRVPSVPPGQYGVHVQHMRYPWQAPMQEKSLEVKAGETTRLALSLVPGATLSGRIVDEDGDPIQGCMIWLQMRDGNNYGMPGFGVENSNDKGEYRVWGIAAGRYLLSAQCGRSPFQPRPFSAGPPPPASLGYPMQFYPAASEISAAQALELKAGEDRVGLDFRINPAPVYTVSGVITAPLGRSLEYIGVNLIRKNDANNHQIGRGGRVGPNGEFQIQGVFPGTYEIVASLHSPNMLDAPLGGRQTIVVTDRPLQVQFAVHSAVDLPGSVTVDGDGTSQVSQMNVQLLQEQGRGPGAPPPPAQVGPDGSFVIKNVLPGRWRVMAWGPGVFLKGIDIAGKSVEGDKIDLAPGTAGPLRLLLSTRTATIEGSGTRGQAYLFRESGSDGSMTMHRSTTADPQGRLQMPGLPPGRYRVYEGNMPDENSLLKEFTVAESEKLVLDLRRAR